MTIEKVDVIVIGAGWFGLAAAKTYLQVDPNVNLVVLDAHPSIGGTWSQELLYDGLKTNNLLGMFQYPDFPMEGLGLDVGKGRHIDGTVILEYLKLYADKFDVTRRIRFNNKVVTAERGEGTWRITTEAGEVIDCDKVMVATGMTSAPFIPAILGVESFGAPIVHTKNFHDKVPTLLKTAKSVTILGGNKSSYDAAYMFASAGVKVNWVIRKSGHGPGWMAPIYVTPLGIWLEKLVTTRFLTWFSPCVWGAANGHPWIRRFLHGTSVGRWIVDRFWDVLTNDLLQLNGYDKHPRTQVLKPWFNTFWGGTALSILNYPTNVFDFVKNGTVDVHLADITNVSSQTVHLSSGVDLQADALVCCTGWQYIPPIKFLPDGIDKEIGLPYTTDQPDPLFDAADKEILTRFPRLSQQPVINPDLKTMTGKGRDANRPFRLYRFIAPPTNQFGHSITFNGMLQCLSTSVSAEVQALWSVAYLTDRLVMDKKTAEERAASGVSFEEEMVWQTTLASRFGRWRCPAGNGSRYPDFVFDTLPYFDTLLQDLDLPSQRKSGFLADCFTPHGPTDFAGLTAEWLGKMQARGPSTRVY